MKPKPCAVCGSVTKPIPSKNGYSLTICIECSLVAMDPQPLPEVLARFYSIETGYHASYSEDFLEMQRNEFAARLETAEKLLSGAVRRSVLDIGAANGLFLDIAKEHGWQTEGVEMNKSNVDICIRNGHRMTHGSFDTIVPTGTFSAVHMGDVIEHMLDPRLGIRKIHQALEPSGIAIVATPNASAFFPRISLGISQLFHISWPHALPPAHTFQFSDENLDELFRQEGFSRVSDKHLNTTFMEEMRDTEYFQTIYDYLKKRKRDRIKIPYTCGSVRNFRAYLPAFLDHGCHCFLGYRKRFACYGLVPEGLANNFFRDTQIGFVEPLDAVEGQDVIPQF